MVNKIIEVLYWRLGLYEFCERIVIYVRKCLSKVKTLFYIHTQKQLGQRAAWEKHVALIIFEIPKLITSSIPEKMPHLIHGILSTNSISSFIFFTCS